LDNFTYSLFGFGVATSFGFGRVAHLATFAALWAAGWKWALGRVRGVLAGRRPGRTLAAWGVALAAGWGILLATAPDRAVTPAPAAEGARAGRRFPNIVVLASDGVSAEHLSLYGYERDTTPFMRTFRPDRALLCENAFANSLNSGGSIASLLAGKQTTALRMYYPPEILTGRDAYEHLPGLLRQLGYWNVDISARHFADAYDLNMQHAFQEANGRTERAGRWSETTVAILGLNAGYFLGATADRLGERLLHAAGVRDADQTYRQVAGEAAGTTQDDEPRIARIERLIADPAARPFFAHAHLMETHGPKFHLERPVFSAGREQKEAFETDFYDDSILELDAAFARIVRALEAAGQLDDTILVLSSDHGKGWGSGRIPLVFWFPDGARAGRIRANVQNVDVAPTILDALGLPVP
ncbi:MAG TPA: sulfatase-like hydrolase/transferase, partial [Kiritimatiellia bacterium]|nr:sulfatase-like hydrolase/transferase [Kiritimatiellia bacterium]